MKTRELRELEYLYFTHEDKLISAKMLEEAQLQASW